VPHVTDRAALDAYLAAHHHVVTSATLATLGYPRWYAEGQVAARRWQRLHAGTWCAYTGPPTWDTRCAAALAIAGPQAALDAGTALDRFGYERLRDDVVHVVVAYGTDVPVEPGLHVRRSRTLTDRSVTARAGLAVVRPERAAVTAALHAPLRAHAILADIVQHGVTVPSYLRGALLVMGRVHHKRAVMAAIADVAGGSRSELERRLIRLARAGGLPPLVQNHPVRVGERRAWIDACWPALGVAVEVDGKAYHVLGEDWERDLDRQNDLVLGDWLVLRVTARALRHHPDRVLGWLRSALASRTPTHAAG
jgi:very-short-patch-repair endonuclease